MKDKDTLSISKKHLKIVGATLIILLIACNLLFINLKPGLYKSIVNYHQNARAFEYIQSSYGGIIIPDDVSVIVVEGVGTLYGIGMWDLYTEPGGRILYGRYYPITKKIVILDTPLDDSDNDAFHNLRHELAHHDWLYNMNGTQKQMIKQGYDVHCIGVGDYRCKNPEEFYATIIGEEGEAGLISFLNQKIYIQ